MTRLGCCGCTRHQTPLAQSNVWLCTQHSNKPWRCSSTSPPCLALSRPRTSNLEPCACLPSHPLCSPHLPPQLAVSNLPSPRRTTIRPTPQPAYPIESSQLRVSSAPSPNTPKDPSSSYHHTRQRSACRLPGMSMPPSSSRTRGTSASRTATTRRLRRCTRKPSRRTRTIRCCSQIVQMRG
jgi:hypothetical protein